MIRHDGKPYKFGLKWTYKVYGENILMLIMPVYNPCTDMI